MRVVPLPDGTPGQRVVVAAPDGDLTSDIAPVEAVARVLEWGPSYTVACALEPGDLETLLSGGHIWLTFVGGMPVFAVGIH